MLCAVLTLALTATRPAAPVEPTLERLAQEVSAALAAKGFEPPLGLYIEGAPAPLQRAWSSLLAARLSTAHLAPVVIDAKDATEAERLARERGVRSLARLTLSLSQGQLTVRGDALSTWVNFWSGAVPTRSGPALAFAHVAEADAQTLALADLPPMAAGKTSLALGVTSLSRLGAVPAALAVGDLDGDRRAEVLVLAGEQVHCVDGTGKTLWRADLSQPPATQSTREAFGVLSIQAGKINAWSAKRERPEWFSATGRPLGPSDGLQLEGIGVKAEPGFNHFQSLVVWAGKTLPVVGHPQAVSVFDASALILFPDGSASLGRGTVPPTRLTGVGTGSALADLDSDGAPEVVVTSARTAGAVDEVRVLAFAEVEALAARGGLVAELSPLWQQPLAGRAMVAAVGDLDGDGTDEVVLGTWLADGTGELVVLRRTAP